MPRFLLAALIMLTADATVRAQVGSVPFFYPGSVGYETTISTITSGPFLAAQSIVSADRKYVTININTANNGLVVLQPYTFATLPNGYVGQTTPPATPNARRAAVKPPPSILDSPGITFIAPLQPGAHGP